MDRELCILFIGLICLGHSYPSSYYIRSLEKKVDSNSKIQECGDRLTSVLSYICQGNYNTLDTVYRRTRDVELQSDYIMNTKTLPFKSREEALSLLRVRRKKRGVSDECCTKSCSLDELKTFCGSAK